MNSDELNQHLEKIKKLKNAADNPLLNLDEREDFKVNIRVNETISPGMFKADPLVPNGYLANSTTIRALKKDIFVVGQDMFEDLEKIISCTGCHKEIDCQFWHFCPFCEAHIPQE